MTWLMQTDTLTCKQNPSTTVGKSRPGLPHSLLLRMIPKLRSSSDLGSPDLGSPDLGSPDLGSPDLGSPDLGSPDLGSPDLGSPDLGSPDLGSPDLGSPDLGSPDGDFLTVVDEFCLYVKVFPCRSLFGASRNIATSQPGHGVFECPCMAPGDPRNEFMWK